MTLEERFEALAGVVSWRAIAAGEVTWLTRELVSTEDARARLRTWALADGVHRPTPDLRDVVRYYGDPEVLPSIVAALGAMAPPARDFVLAHVSIVASGFSSNGWTGAMPPGPRLIVLCAPRPHGEITRTMLHEGGHCWLDPMPETLLLAASRMDLTEMAEREQWPQLAEYRAGINAKESRVRALAAVWEQTL